MNHWERYGPAPEAYSRVTNPERFRPLHTFMMDLIGRLEATFDVERLEGYGLDDELEKGDLVRRSVRLVPPRSERCTDPLFVHGIPRTPSPGWSLAH
jgi:hypothetical protein